MKNFLRLIILGATAATLSACGSGGANSVLKNLSLKTYQDNNSNDTMVQLTADLGTTSLVFPVANLTFVDPKDPTRQLGMLSLGQTIDGHNSLTLTADASSLKLPGGLITDSNLPNGNPIPVTGVSNLVALQAGNSKTKIYLGESSDKLLVGVAVAMKEFDALGRVLPGVNLFFPFSQSNVSALAGFFSGTTSGTSGVAVFATTTWQNPVGGGNVLPLAQSKLSGQSSFSSSPSINLLSSKPSTTDQWKLNYFLWDLNRRGGQLHLSQ